MKKWLLMLIVIVVGLSLNSLGEPQVQANAKEIQIYFEGERLIFEDTDPVLIDGRTLVPFRKIFETLGFEVEWIGGTVRQAIGEKEGSRIELTIDHKVAQVNGKAIELDVTALLYQSRVLVPLRFVSENSGYYVDYTNQNGLSIIGIGLTEDSAKPNKIDPITPAPSPKPEPEPEPDPGSVSDLESVEPYVAKGQVVNSLGQPLAGVTVYADNTFVYDSWIEGITDEQGYYELQLPIVATSYRMGAIFETDYNGEIVPFHFDPEPNSPFSNKEGAIRNFVLDINKGTIQIFSFDYYDDEEAPDVNLVDVEFTLKSVGQLVDGSKDRTLIVSPDRTNLTVNDVPIGTYEISAVWKPTGYKEVPMLVSIRSADQFQEKVTLSFENSFSDVYVAQIDLSF